MPLPTPHDGESRDDFMARCMSDAAIQADFDDQDQRLAVCNSQWSTMKLFDLSYTGNEPPEHTNILFKSFELGKETKQVDGEDFEVATFTGIANVMEKEDLGGDIIHKGAFKKTLEEKGGKVPFVTDHTYKISNYAGVAYLQEDGNELQAKVEVLLTNNQAGQEFYTKAKFANSHNDPLGLSIGYDIPEGKKEIKDGVRHIYEIKLWELTGTIFPMSQGSRAVGFKELFNDLNEYSRTDLQNAKTIIDSLLNTEPSDDTHDDEAELKEAEKLLEELKSSNKQHQHE